MGVLLALLGATGFSFMNVFIRNGVRLEDEDDGMLTTMVVNAAIFSVLLIVVVSTVGLVTFNTAGLAWFVLAGLSATLLGRQSLFGGILRIGAARASAIKNATPLVTVVIAVSLLNERLTLLATLGIALVMVGLAAIITDSLRSSAAAPVADESGHPLREAIESEAMVEGGLWDRTVARIASPSRRTLVVGVIFAALAAIFFGTAHAARKVGMDLLPNALMGATVGTWTALLAYLAVATARGQTRALLRRTTASFRPYLWGAGVAATVGQLSFFAALSFAPVSHVAVVAGAETIITVMLVALLSRRFEVITRHVVLPAVLVTAGTVLIGLAG